MRLWSLAWGKDSSEWLALMTEGGQPGSQESTCDKRFLLSCQVGELRDSDHAGLKANVPQIRVYIAVPLQVLTAAGCVSGGSVLWSSVNWNC